MQTHICTYIPNLSCRFYAKNNMNVAEAFLEDALAVYVIAAACSILNIEDSSLLLGGATAFQTVPHLASEIVTRFIDITSYGEQHSGYLDEVYRYTQDTLTLGLLSEETQTVGGLGKLLQYLGICQSCWTISIALLTLTHACDHTRCWKGSQTSLLHCGFISSDLIACRAACSCSSVHLFLQPEHL